MGQPTTRADAAQIFHVNFHTMGNRPIFANPDYDALMWQVMPTHVHLVLLTFPDLPLGQVMRLIKVLTAHALLALATELRGELGDHIWQEGYDWVEITTQRQCAAAVRYVQENRRAAGLED
jgi:REP element-mobilizing transposase RayT